MTASYDTDTHSRRSKKENPLGLFIASIRDGKTLDDSERKRTFRELVNSEDYEHFRDAIVSEWMNIKYNTAAQAAFPPTVQDIKKSALNRKQTMLEEDAAFARAKTKIQERLFALTLDFMIGDRRLGDHTGPELVKLGGMFRTIGKQIGNKTADAALKTDAALIKCLKK